MRTVVLPGVLAVALLLPQALSAQVYRQETAPPAVTAANAPWQVAGEPIFHAGNFYYPAGARVFFDGKVMVRTGVYEGVPLYADVTIEPYSIVYVPVGGAVMQPYERLREGELAGTVGSKVPSFPIQRDVEASAEWDGLASAYPYPYPSVYPPVTGLAPVPRVRARQEESRVEATPRSDEPFEPVGAVMISPQNRPSTGTPREFANANLSATGGPEGGVWISFQNARWFAAGRAVAFDPARFEPAGTFNGFPIYRERGGSADRIFVTTVRNGPIAPFERR